MFLKWPSVRLLTSTNYRPPVSGFRSSSVTLFTNYYNVLGVDKNASLKEIKDAYIKLALVHHPDSSKLRTDSNIKFQNIKEAYEFLCDDTKRWTWHREHFPSSSSIYSDKDFDMSHRHAYQGGTPKYYQRREIGERVRAKKNVFWYIKHAGTNRSSDEEFRFSLDFHNVTYLISFILFCIGMTWSVITLPGVHSHCVKVIKFILEPPKLCCQCCRHMFCFYCQRYFLKPCSNLNFRSLSDRRNYYDVLGIPTNSAQTEIKDAYIHRAKRLHPDTQNGTAQEFKQILEAYNTLKNPLFRKKYDSSLAKSLYKNEVHKDNCSPKQAAQKVDCSGHSETVADSNFSRIVYFVGLIVFGYGIIAYAARNHSIKKKKTVLSFLLHALFDCPYRNDAQICNSDDCKKSKEFFEHLRNCSDESCTCLESAIVLIEHWNSCAYFACPICSQFVENYLNENGKKIQIKKLTIKICPISVTNENVILSESNIMARSNLLTQKK